MTAADDLHSMRWQLDAANDALCKDLHTIAQFLADGIRTDALKKAFSSAPDHMNEIRFLLSKTENLTHEAEHPKNEPA